MNSCIFATPKLQRLNYIWQTNGWTYERMEQESLLSRPTISAIRLGRGVRKASLEVYSEALGEELKGDEYMEAPKEPSFTLVPELQIRTATEADLKVGVEIRRAYFAHEALPLGKLLEWYHVNPYAFLILTSEKQTIGLLDILPLRERAIQHLLNGGSECDLTADDLYPPHEKRSVGAIYFESIIINEPLMRQGIRLFQLIARQNWLVRRICLPEHRPGVFALAFFKNHFHLFRKLGLKPDQNGERRADGHVFFSASWEQFTEALNAQRLQHRRSLKRIDLSRLSSPIIRGIMDLQRQHHVTPQSVGEGSQQNGFLVGLLDGEKLRGLIKAGGQLYVAWDEDFIVGYLLTTPVALFEASFAEPTKAKIELLRPVQLQNARFIYHIAVDAAFQHIHFGQLLLNAAKKEGQGRLLTDVVISPLHNYASLTFFQKNGFERIGTLTDYTTEWKPALETAVLYYEPILDPSKRSN